jgi:hypothetical protein
MRVYHRPLTCAVSLTWQHNTQSCVFQYFISDPILDWVQGRKLVLENNNMTAIQMVW